MSEYDYCDAHVSTQFERVLGDDDGRILACPDCSTRAGIAQVAADRRWTGV